VKPSVPSFICSTSKPPNHNQAILWFSCHHKDNIACPSLINALRVTSHNTIPMSNQAGQSNLRRRLAEAGIEFFVPDRHISAVEGNIGAFPRRVVVDAADLGRARVALAGVEPG